MDWAERRRRRRRVDLQRTLVNCHQRLSDLPADANEETRQTLRSVQAELRTLDNSDSAGVKIRSRVHWTESGETSTGFFAGHERQPQKEALLTELDYGGRRCGATNELLEAAASFYECLYTASTTDPISTDRLIGSLERSLSDDESSSLELPVSPDEIRNAMSSLATNKSPGIDGLPVEFYRRFWTLVADDLMDVYREVLSSGRLGASQRTGVIRLLYKKGDRCDLRNWRPITLLTTDYKILAKALPTRLSRDMPTVIHGDQTCSVPGRSIRDSCRLLQDVVDYCEAIDQEAAFVSLDQEKAFGRVDWSYLDRVLTAMNFGPVFRSYVSTLYNGISSRVVVNVWLSRRIRPTRGVRQGCPLSPILYVLIAETLGSLIRSSTVFGLPLPASVDRLKVIQYADDTTVVASSDTDFAVLEDCLSTYQEGSGAKLNIAKSRGLFFSSWRERSDSPLSLTWTAGSIKILGIVVGPSASLNLVNWQSAIDKTLAVFRAWQHRDLSIGGRALVARAFATSKLWYVAQVVPAPLGLQDNSSVWNFIWKCHAALASRRVCCRHPRAGGIGES